MANEKEKKFLLKDHLFNRGRVEALAGDIQTVYSDFPRKDFVRETLAGFKSRELKARIRWMGELLRKHLPADYRKATRILLKSLPPPLDPTRSDDDFGDFIYAPLADFVALYGCNAKDLEFSLEALRQITQRFSAEDAIRYFLNAFPDETMAKIHIWKTDPHYHVRRLCSEGLRPRLPWAQKISIPATLALPVLEALYADETRYVTRSVANHMNDVAKVDPELALKTLERWKKGNRQKPEEMNFVLSHSLRGLVKQGHPEALRFLGYNPAPPVQVSDFKAPGRVKMGDSLDFSFNIRAQEPTALIVDYLIHFVNKTGKLNSGKVFKLKKVSLKKGEKIAIKKRHMLQPKMTTRTLYAGAHYLELQINGQSLGKKKFELV